MKKRRNSKAQRTPLSVFIFGIFFSFFTLLLLSFIASLILISTKNPNLSIKVCSFATLLASGAISGFAISKYRRDLSFGISVFATLSVAVLMLAISLISTKGNVSGGIFMNYLCYVLISVFFSFIGRRKTKRHHR